MSRQLIFAFGAGAVAALFYVAIGLGSFGSLILAYLAPLPLFAVGLGAGFVHAAIAVGVGAALIAATLPPSVAGLFLVTVALPVLVLTNRALLNRTGPDGGVEWYPTGHLLAVLNAIALAALVAALPFVFLGLSVIHAVSVRWPARVFILVCVYLGLLMAGWPALIVAAIGVLETWLSLRQRFSGGRRQDEEE